MKTKILIVKCSSLGDILQSFIVVEYLHARLPHVEIDWLVEKKYEDLVVAHPQIDHVVSVDFKRKFSLLREIRKIRKKQYDWIFDLQGNCKSFLMTFFSVGKKKIGFGRKSVSEWPNLLATHVRFDPDPRKNMSLQYVEIAQRFLKDSAPVTMRGSLLKVPQQERAYCERLVQKSRGIRLMVSPSSRWENKKLSISLWKDFLQLLSEDKDPFFYFIWGTQEEKNEVQKLASYFPNHQMVEKLSLPALQMLMSQMDLLLAVDSCMLHLGVALPHLATFSFFGPTRFEIFKPVGDRHLAFQAVCPYKHTFLKSCPYLRSCRTGNCLKDISFQEIDAAASLCKTLLSTKNLVEK